MEPSPSGGFQVKGAGLDHLRLTFSDDSGLGWDSKKPLLNNNVLSFVLFPSLLGPYVPRASFEAFDLLTKRYGFTNPPIGEWGAALRETSWRIGLLRRSCAITTPENQQPVDL